MTKEAPRNDQMVALQEAVRLHRQGLRAQAEELYRQILVRDPNNAGAIQRLGILEAERDNLDAAEGLLGRAVVLQPGDPVALYNYGNVLRALRRHEEALGCYDRALAFRPQGVELLTNRGAVLAELGRPHEAVASYDRALAIDPRHVAAHFNRGNAMRHLGRPAEAFASYRCVLALQPAHLGALDGCGSALRDLHRFEEAHAIFERAHAIDPELDYLDGHRLHAKIYVCDWNNFEADRARLCARIGEGKRAAEPFPVLVLSDSPAEQLRCAEVYVADRYPARITPRPPRRLRQERKIRVGYVSGEFREQATAYLTADLFECHDRKHFEFHAIATGPSDASPMRARLERAFDRFIVVHERTDDEIVARIRAEEIDILVNLNGYFGAERTGIFAARPSPVQVNYLGFPGTMGAGYMDYIVADETVIPQPHKQYYAEKVVYLPHSYQPNDRKRPLGEKQFGRVQCGLPERGFVFCCFNSPHKLSPVMFDVWMRLLGAVEHSVLWLLAGIPAVERNLKSEAEKRGIAPERLRFAPVLPLAEHVARERLADLFLDTLPHNAHTTASDALWSGVPVVTCAGTTFAGRVAASLLNAIGMGELVTHNLAEYEALALRLARDPVALAEARAKLSLARTQAPLFDTPTYARHIESAYRTMWERAERGVPPESFRVESISTR